MEIKEITVHVDVSRTQNYQSIKVGTGVTFTLGPDETVAEQTEKVRHSLAVACRKSAAAELAALLKGE